MTDPAAIKFDDDTVVEDIDLAEEEIFVDGERLTDERADAIAEDVLAKVRRRFVKNKDSIVNHDRAGRSSRA